MVIPNYRGFEIEVVREQLQLSEVMSYAITRNSDGLVLDKGIEYRDMTVREKIDELKHQINKDTE